MLTYNYEHIEEPMYQYIYKCIKEDILSGVLRPGEKLPSKRTFANNNGISTITIQNAYDQLISEGYVSSIAKKGYYVAKIEGMSKNLPRHKVDCDINFPYVKEHYCDFSSNSMQANKFVL